MDLRRALHRPCRHRFVPSHLESLELRDLLAAVTVDVSQVVRQVNTELLGVNTAWWDSSLNTAETAQMVEAAGLNLFRLPGGSSPRRFSLQRAPHLSRRGNDPEHGQLRGLGERPGRGDA